MITIDEMLVWRKKHIWEKLDVVARAKSHDYSGIETDTFKNIRLVDHLTDGRVTSELGLVPRIGDKYSRLTTLVTNDYFKRLGVKFEVPAVKEERIEDTIEDMINYLTYLLILRAERTNGGTLPE